jgi:replicative DNA helicase
MKTVRKKQPNNFSTDGMEFLAIKDISIEKCLLGSIICENDRILEVPDLKPTHFFDENNGKLFALMHRLYHQEKKGFDDKILILELKDSAESDWGSKLALSEHLKQSIDECVPNNIKYYAQYVMEFAFKRELYKFGYTTQERAKNGLDIQSLISVTQEDIQNIGKSFSSKDSALITICEPNRSTTWEHLGSELESIEWDWSKRIAKGFLHITAASSGFGKSALMLNVFGRSYILGKPWPDGIPFDGETGCIGWGEAEAAQKINILRAKAWGLPVEKIIPPFENAMIDLQLWLPEHQDAVWRLLRRPNIRAFVVDSLRGACKGDENSSEFISNTKVLAEIARDVNKPIFAIHHFKKRTVEEKSKSVTLDDLRGSSAIVQLSRIVWAIDCPLFEMDKGEQKRLSIIKSNLDILPDPLGFKITESGIEYGEAPEAPRQESNTDKAADLLLALLHEGPKLAEELEREIEGAGLSWFAAKNAKKKLGIVSTRDGINQCWYWSLSDRSKKQ